MKQVNSGLLFDPSMVITVNRITDPVFYVFDYQNSPLTMEFQHFHTYWEIYILYEDSAGHVIEGEYFSLQRGDIVLLKPLLLHKSTYEEDTRSKKRLVVAMKIDEHPVGFERETQRILSLFEEKIPIFRFEGSLQQEIHRLLNTIYRLGNQQPINVKLMIHQSFCELLWLIYAHKRENLYTKQKSNNTVSEKIYTITSYLHAHFNEELNLTTIATHFDISPFYFSRQFKKVTGTSYVTYIQLIKLRFAQNQLLFTKKTIQDICEESGFTSFSQFNRVFHQYCKMSPSAFRKGTKDQALLLLKQTDPEKNKPATQPRILQSNGEQAEGS